MKKTFSRILNEGSKISKYLVFSFTFVLAFLLGATKVGAANTDYPYHNNDELKQESGSCSASGLDHGYLSYVLKSSNYKGSANNCVVYSYEEDDGSTTKYFYLKGEDDHILTPNTDKLQTIQFTINTSDVGNFKYIAIFESTRTLGGTLDDLSNTASYDLYEWNGTSATYTLIEPNSSGHDNTTYHDSSKGIDKGHFTHSSSTLTFSYAMRNPKYGLNSVYIYFYDDKTDQSNITKRTEVSFYFAKPIADFESELKTSVDSCTLTVSDSSKICVVYSNVTPPTTAEKQIAVYFPRNAAFYFSTVNNHEATPTTAASKADIEKYNSIYATNTFQNGDGSEVKYLYYNASDETVYTGDTNDKINVAENKNYAMKLTIDANGSYVFTITDVFGTVNTTTTATVSVTDTSSRDIDIYFLKSSSSTTAADSHRNNDDNNDGTMDNAAFFAITDRNSLTKNNVSLYYELFFTVQIKETNGTQISTQGIIASPLNSAGTGKELKVDSSDFCKIYVTKDGTNRVMSPVENLECVTSTQSKFTRHNLTGTQSVDATYDALNTYKSEAGDYSIGSLVNSFAFSQGALNISGEAVAVTGTYNKSFVWVNENGSYRFVITDIYGNHMEAFIDVSIIDQYQPTITFDSSIASNATKLCTSTYVYGGRQYSAAIYNGEASTNNNCAASSITYDVTSDNTLSTAIKALQTGRVEGSDRFYLDKIGTDTLKLLYYNTSGARSFNYADAIRIARLTAYDSITSLTSKDASSKTITHKSTYAKTNNTYEAYAQSALAIEDNAKIVEGNYLQYSSELTPFATNTSDLLQVYVEYNSSGSTYTRVKFSADANDTVCNSTTNATNCYKYINSYIDRGIDFKLVFKAIDFVGNISNEYTITVDVVDDTAPGVMNINPETGSVTAARPNIALTNIDTLCRIEVGNKAQLKRNILDCYGFASLDGNSINRYKFADNKAGITAANTFIAYDAENFANDLSYQWYKFYNAHDVNIEVQIEVNGTWTTLADGTAESARNITLNDAGYYKIKFIITDNKLSGSTSTDPLTNTTTFITWYYVNPKVLLIAPQMQTHVYGNTTATLGYDIYISADDTTFHTNIYALDEGNLPAALAKYTKADTSDNDFLILGNRAMAGELKVIETKYHDGKGAGIWTEDATKHVSINTQYSIDAGSYYITLGDLYVRNTNIAVGTTGYNDTKNYIIRLHPAYLINGQTPSVPLANYDDASVEENVSSVNLIITQRRLNVSANGGTKMYGVIDTNYLYANTVDSVTNSNHSANIAYLNGYTVEATNNSAGTGFAYSDSVTTQYSANKSIIEGALRRQAGEKVGTYSICNFDVRSSGSILSPQDYTNNSTCGSSDVGKWGIQSKVTVTITTSNVYYLKDGAYSSATVTATQISNGELVGYYVKHTDDKYYKITHDNVDASDKSKLYVYTNTWLATYDGVVYDTVNANDALQINVNDENGNKNYIISYTNATYTITTRDLVIQPGINQGKEYSTPAHADPKWQIVIYGEMEKYITKANGYTVDIGLSYDDTDPTNATYPYGGGTESEIYFNRRKRTDSSAVYNYSYDVAISSDVFTLDGVEYKVVSNKKICRNTTSGSELECYESATENGPFVIGKLNSVILSSSTKAVVTITGNLKYQNYTLFRSSTTSDPGTGYISRESGEDVAWYAFKNDLSKLLPVYDDKATTGANYTTSYNDNAPSFTDGTPDVYLTLQGSPTNEYKPNGTDACNSGYYTEKCEGTFIKPAGTSTKKILFEIFKRDIILSFNYVDDAYGYAYVDYKAWYFTFSSSDESTPKNAKDGNNMVTCYMKASEQSNGGTEYTVNGIKYVKIDDCNGNDLGLATSDNWGSGSNGLGLSFKLSLEDDELYNKASGLVYALPAGLHYVHASITNDNYRLIYVDYYAVKTAGDNSGNGAVDVKSSNVILKGTSYQKEYGQAIYDKYDDNGTWTNASVNIFDLNYVGCQIASGANVGCGYNAGTGSTQDGSSTEIAGLGALNTKNQYNSLANIYGYTVAAKTDYVFAGGPTTANANLTVVTDTIFNNFSGLPVRDRGSYASNNADDVYGLLDGAGRYTISLDNIKTIFAKYTNDDATKLGVAAPNLGSAADISTSSKIMITRYTNYSIDTTNSTTGTLYILPARIDIEVTDGQTKMYGCAYNGGTATPSWTRDGGYSNCDENIADYYDFGYKYNVFGDKTYELLESSSTKLKGYTSFSIANTIANYGSVSDLSYGNDKTPTKEASYTVEGIVASHANSADKNNVSYTVVGQASAVVLNNISLNNGVLYRALLSGGTEAEYSYANYWKYANDALAKNGGKYKGFQNQSVGTYVLTLGNLDAVFNLNNHCNATSDPTSNGTNNCKNFIVYKVDGAVENNTSTHTKSSSTEAISDADLKHTYSSEFTITKRSVKLHTEYNYKVYGDTDSLEGFTCAQIASMYTRTSGYNSGATFSFDGRSFGCTSADATYINMGTARYYAVDNSLAKAPWTQWSDDRQVTTEVSTPSSYYLYDDILWDVIQGELARTNENGSKSAQKNDGGINDKVGKYTYDWSSVTLKNADDYTQEVLKGANRTDDSDGYVKTLDIAVDQGFFTLDASSVMQRWYSDAKHNQKATATSGSYTYYSFVINDTITNYPFANDADNYGEVYYEIVKREIILVVDDVEKDYGIEDTYALFTVKLCSIYDTDSGECTLRPKNEAYGNRNALSQDDYDWFITEAGAYNQEHIKGYTNTTGVGRFVGSATKNESASTRGSFGIYFFRSVGEEVGTYTVKACPTQLSSSNPDCTASDAEIFKAGTDGTNYNAANYIITSYTGSLKVNTRDLKITPDADQGFQYGNYETGTRIAPITFTESYTGVALNNGASGYNTNTAVGGLVNGAIGVTTSGAAISDDSLAKQYGLCLFNISSKSVVCINDRQNSTLSKTTTHQAYTAQYATSSSPTNAMPTSLTAVWVYNNVYNDEYAADNAATSGRMALDRVIGESTDSQRYNRNVGTYTIVAGELKADGEKVCASDSDKNCLNTNYDITGFESGITYTITPAAITVATVENQDKIYGQKDVEINFTVSTTFTTAKLPVDYYYCGNSQDACKQSFAKKGADKYAGEVDITYAGFAYSEDLTGGDYNYGKSQESNKKTNYKEVNQATITGVKYYDKYCLSASVTCSDYDEGSDVSLTYASTDRILLGYLYLEGWAQTAGSHNVLNGMVVALNEHSEKNYTLNFASTVDTGIDFTINKLELAINIENITKTYGEATDAYKCENGNCNIRLHNETGTLLTALNNENRLEFNFNVVNTGNSSGVAQTGVEDKDAADPTSVIYLTHQINGKYYTQTAGAETKNVHLGLTVARSNLDVDGNACTVSNDLYGCEDATSSNGYALRFVHSIVTDSVDSNYKLFIDGDEVGTGVDTDTNFIAISRGEDKDTKTTFADDDTYVGGDYRGKLVINKRNITFYIGTYNSVDLVHEKFTIEQNESLPNTPVMVDASKSFAGQMSKDDLSSSDNTNNHVTDPAEKQVLYVTWFDNDDPRGVFARQVRSADVILSSVSSSTGDNTDNAYGVGYCSKPLVLEDTAFNSVNKVTPSVCSGKGGTLLYPSQANKQTNGVYAFDTSLIGTYALIRDKTYTGVSNPNIASYSSAYETKNYTTIDVNGTLVVYEDKTAPIIEVPEGMTYTIEANAHWDGSAIVGKQVGLSENQWSDSTLGNAIKYLTMNYSNFPLNGVAVTSSNTKNLVEKNNLAGTIASDNASAFASYCKKLEATECTELFMMVNNRGLTSSNFNETIYNVDRSANTYDWDADVIDSQLEAVSSIISWFNISSYDYGYIREGQYVAKRYTPRYYIFINGTKDGTTLNHFDPRYVGTFTVSIYAVDNIGNVSAATTVDLIIKDETKPVSGSMYLFNTQVKCTGTDKECATDITKWIVDAPSAGKLVHINSFVKYSNTSGTVDDVNGTYIYMNNGYKSLYGGVDRYNASGNKDVAGMYIKVTSSDTVPALQVEHRYWNNTDKIYLVVVGGSDNSYLNNNVDTTNKHISIDLAQWSNYYKINTSWYKFTTTAKSGVEISTNEGINEVIISAIDSGAKVTSTEQSHTYYDAKYLAIKGTGCAGIGDCTAANEEEDILRDIPPIVDGKFSLLGTEFTIDAANGRVTWPTNQSADINVEDGKYTFVAGIITCEFSDNTFTSFSKCSSYYDVVYKNSNKKTITIDNYKTITASLNISDLDTSADSGDAYYRDRKYVLIDKTGGSMTMTSEGYKVFEFGCSSGCDVLYDEKYLTYSEDTDNTRGVLSTTGTAITDTAMTALFATLTGYTVKGYTGEAGKAEAFDSDDLAITYSGIPSFTTASGTDSINVMNGTTAATNKVNYFYTYMRVYLGIRKNDGSIAYFRYTVLWNGTKFDVYRVTGTAADTFSIVGEYNASSKLDVGTITTIEEVLEKIVTTASAKAANGNTEGVEYQFDINYDIYDLAGNRTATTIVRGITFVKLTSSINVSVAENSPVAQVINNNGSSYVLNVNQGTSLKSLLSGFTVTNIDRDGKNNVSSIKQSLYYNGEAIFENLPYNADVLDIIDGYGATPGTYTLRLTSTRSVDYDGETYLVVDDPVEMNFVVNPAMAIVENNSDYSSIIGPMMLIGLTGLFLLGFGYIAIKKSRKND